MIVELGNQAAPNALDQSPCVTTIHVPDGYTHNPNVLSVDEFRNHRQEAIDYRNGITQLPEHEALLSVVAAWPSQSREKPTWVKVTPSEYTESGVAEDLESLLREFYRIDQDRPANVEDTHWTRFGAPGQFPDPRPNPEALFTNSGRVIANINDGGGQWCVTGTGTAATATSLTTATTAPSANSYAGYRVYAMQTATGPLLWANVVSNTTGANSVLTVDQWYSAANTLGQAATTPSAGFYYMIADGGVVSAWFVGMTTTNITPAVADTALTGEYGTASGGYLRKIAPYAQTSGVASRSITLTPVFTGNASDTYPSTFYAIGVGTSIVRPFPAGTMKFETSLNASATVNASGDQVTVTETITGS